METKTKSEVAMPPALVNRYEGRHEADSFVVFDADRVVVLNDDCTRSGIHPSD